MRTSDFFLASAIVSAWLLAAFLPGCGPTPEQTRVRYFGVVDRCLADLGELQRTCPSGDECIARARALQAQCNHEIDAVCSTRRARRVCE